MHWLQSLFRKSRLDRELDAELRFHLDAQIEANLRTGMTREEARRQAQLTLGGVEQVKEHVREVRPGFFLETLWQDIRFGARMLRKNPGFTIVAVLTLALGIGANTAIFSVVNAVLLRPLPLKDADRLVALGEWNPQVSNQPLGASFPNYTDWSQKSGAFELMTAYLGQRLTLTGRGEPRRVSGLSVSSNFFSLLGVDLYAGRVFTPQDENAYPARVVVITYGLWKQMFGGDPAAVGQVLLLDSVPRTVVGILPPRFHFLQDVDVITPLALSIQARQMRGMRFLRVIGRLKPGVSLQRAQTDMDGIAASLAREYPNWDENWGVALTSLHDQVVGRARNGLLVLFGTVGLVLLIACANVANLTLARGSAREKEVAIRAALGAGRIRMVRFLLTESLLLALLSGAVAFLLAFWGVDLLRALSPASLPRVEEVSVDGRVLWFTLLVSLVTGLLFGTTPARQALRVNPQEALKEGARSSAGGPARLRGALVVTEVALSFVLLVGAGLLGRSLYQLLSLDPGFRSENLLAFDIPLPLSKYSREDLQANFFRELVERARSFPGVRSAALTTVLPLSGADSRNSFMVEGSKSEDADWANLWEISPDYFRTMGIPLREGRAFTEQDTKNAPPVAIINEAMAGKYWPKDSPLGKRLLFGDSGPAIVGVVGNVKAAGLAGPDEPQIYLCVWQQPIWQMTLVLRTEGDPLALVPPMRALVQSIDTSQPIERIQTVSDLLSRAVAQPRLVALLLGSFSALSLVLVAVGIYGVISYSVGRRTHEIGIRMALGAQPADVVKLVVGQGLKLIGVGLAIGSLSAVLATRALRSLLFEVRPTDPLTFLGVAVVLSLVAVAACYLPARRATRVDPIVALRYE